MYYFKLKNSGFGKPRSNFIGKYLNAVLPIELQLKLAHFNFKTRLSNTMFGAPDGSKKHQNISSNYLE